jgi:hypothetical protein
MNQNHVPILLIEKLKFTKYGTQSVCHLSQCTFSSNTINDGRHQIIGGFRSFIEYIQLYFTFSLSRSVFNVFTLLT